MSKQSYVNGNVNPSSHTFSQWLNKTNQIIYDMGNFVVTTSPVSQPNTTNGGLTSGNAHISGIFSANTFATPELRGGTVSTSNDLFITSNAHFTKSELIRIYSNTENFTVNANTSTFTGNFYISNTTKDFTASSNSILFTTNTYVVNSNTTYNAPLFTINSTNTNIYGVNLNLNTSNTIINSNTVINGTNLDIKTTNINVGDSTTDKLNVLAKIATSLIPFNTTIDIGNSTNYFNNIYGNTLYNSNNVFIGNSLGFTGDGRRTIYSRSATSGVDSSIQFSFRNNTNTEVNAYYFDQTVIYPKSNSVVSFGTNTNRFGSIYANSAIFTVNATIGGNTDITGVANAASIRARNLTGNRVSFTNSTNYIIDSANLTYDGTTLTVNTLATSTGINTTGGLSVGGVATITGNTTIAGNVTVNGTNLQVNGVVNTNALTIRSAANLNMLYSVSGVVTGSTNLTYNGSTISVTTANATVLGLTTNGGISVGGDVTITGNNIVSGSENITGVANASSIRARNLTGNRVSFTNSTNYIVDSANLTYDGTTFVVNTLATSTGINTTGGLSVGGVATITGNTSLQSNLSTTGNGQFGGSVNTSSITLRNTTNTGITYSDSGNIITSTNLTYNGSTISVTTANATVLGLTTNGGLSIGGTVTVTGNNDVSGSGNITGVANAASIRARNLTGNRVSFTNSTNYIVDSANLTYDGTKLTVNTATATVGLGITGGATIGGALTVSGATAIGALTSGTQTITGDSNISGVSNTSTLRVRNFTTVGSIPLVSDINGNIATSTNISFVNNTLTLNGANATTNSLTTTGGVSIGGSGSVTGDMNVTGNTVITGNLRVYGTAILSTNTSFAVNTSTVDYMTIGQELVLPATAKTVGSLIPKTTNINDLGSATLIYRTVYANNIIGNVDWSNITTKPSPTITITGDVSGSGTLTNLGNVSIALNATHANSTASGFINTSAQTISGVKTFTSTIVGSINGNANTATKLQTTRTINGTSFDGTSNIVISSRILKANETANTSLPLAFVNDTFANYTNGSIKDIATASTLNYHLQSGTLTCIDYNTSSDKRFKTNINTIEKGLNKVENLRGVEYDRIDTEKHYVGLIAQEVEEVIPEAVHEDENGYKYISYGNLVGVLIEAVKELSAKIKDLEQKDKK